MLSDREASQFVLFLINLAMLVTGTVLARRVYSVFGALGIAAYLGHLSYAVFKDSLAFPIVLVLIGLGVVWLGVVWHRHEAEIDATLQRYIPAKLRGIGDQA